MDDFYDRLASFYHLIFADWDASIASQADLLEGIIRAEWGASAQSVLDAACGIGTQSLALAARGFQVTASDLSPGAVARAQKEAAARRLQISFSVCDMRALYRHHGGGFDVVVCAGNAIPHLLSDAEIVQALEEMHACLRPGGGCLLTIRPYDREARDTGIIKPFGVRHEGDKRYVIFQVWDFEGEQYALAMYFIEEDELSGTVKTHVMRSRYYAIHPEHLLALMGRAGFEHVKKLDEHASQPATLVGTKPRSA